MKTNWEWESIETRYIPQIPDTSRFLTKYRCVRITVASQVSQVAPRKGPQFPVLALPKLRPQQHTRARKKKTPVFPVVSEVGFSPI